MVVDTRHREVKIRWRWNIEHQTTEIRNISMAEIQMVHDSGHSLQIAKIVCEDLRISLYVLAQIYGGCNIWGYREGLVDTCITNDSDAFLHGVECLIKCLQEDCKEPIVECYRTSDLDTILRLKRKYLIALVLLVGCDYNTHGVLGIGLNNVVRIVPEDEILSQLRELGEGNASLLSEMDTSRVKSVCLYGGTSKGP
eukprot:Gb_26791 [translate_table: standard]